MLRNPEFWVLLPFITFLVLFGRRLWGVITTQLDNRAAAIRAELDEAHRLRSEAERMLEDAKRERDEALAESSRMLDRAQEEAARLAAATLAEAEATAKRRERMALDRIAAAERAVVSEMRGLAAEVAAAAAERVFRETLDAGADDALVERAIAALPRSLRAA